MANEMDVQLEPITQGLWHAESRLRMPAGGRLPIRMSVLRLDDGGLLVCSPIQLGEGLAQAVEALGPVRYLLAPNAFHHLFLTRWQARFPDAHTCAPSALRSKRPDLRIDRILDGTESAPFGPGIEVALIEGMPKVQELALYHQPSRSLVLTDLIFNIREAKGVMAWVLRLMGTYGRPASSRLVRLFIKDREAYARSVERLLALPVERVIMAHGEILEGAACAALQVAQLDGTQAASVAAR